MTQHTAWVLRRGTSPVDWCEANYTFSPFIAEFVNTFSNVLFFVYPPLLSKLFQEYAYRVNRGVYVIWALLLTIGLASAYFHATLSLVGQLLDELCILWLLTAAFAMWCPRRHIFQVFKDRNTFQLTMLLISVATTMLACIHPVVNAFILMIFGTLTIALLYFEIKRCEVQRVVKLGHRCFWIFSMAYVCWISDRLFCEVWLELQIPYLHGAWHILIAIVAYSVCALFAYFDACEAVPEQLPMISFWPDDRFELGVPYVEFKNPHMIGHKVQSFIE